MAADISTPKKHVGEARPPESRGWVVDKTLRALKNKYIYMPIDGLLMVSQGRFDLYILVLSICSILAAVRHVKVGKGAVNHH